MPSVLYCPSTEVALPEYGIKIPLSANRRKQVLEHLRATGKESVIWEAAPVPYTRPELERVHTRAFIHQLERDPEAAIVNTFELKDEHGRPHRYDPAAASRPLSEMVVRHLAHARGSLLAMERALKDGDWCFYAGGGMHHAMSFGGRGFCLVNDIMLGLVQLKQSGAIKEAWVIDVDAHKGDGTAEIARHHAWAQTLSIHMEKGWPLDHGSASDPWYLPNTIDIGIAEGEESLYLARLREGMAKLQGKPELAVVVLGADPWEKDALPSTAPLKLTKAQLLERDLFVHQFLRSRGIPVAYVMAGGYGEDSWQIYAQFLDAVLT